jgi:uncharacterized repeat protein (TIGR01451 family)
MNARKLSSVATFLLVLLTTATSACGQNNPRRMIPGASVKELIPESPNERVDGISKIIIGQLFKPGNAEYTRIGAADLKDAPSLPTGYVLFKDLVFQVKTEATISGYHLTVFNLPSAENESDFNRLSVLHLEDDEMSPAGKSWEPTTVVPGGWDDHYHFVSKSQYELLRPDFRSRRLAAVTHAFGIFALALAPDASVEQKGPFTSFEIVPSSSPQPVEVGQEITHTIIVKNRGPRPAAEVNVRVSLDAFFGYKGTPTQGQCKRSDQSTDTVLCYLGAIQSGATATITIVGRVAAQPLLNDGINERANELEAVFKANSTDLVEANNQIFMRFDFNILKKP